MIVVLPSRYAGERKRNRRWRTLIHWPRPVQEIDHEQAGASANNEKTCGYAPWAHHARGDRAQAMLNGKQRFEMREELISRLGGDQLPVWIARSDLLGKGPNIGNFANFLRVTVDHLSLFVSGGRDQLADELDCNQG